MPVYVPDPPSRASYAARIALTAQYVDQPSTVKSLKARDDVLGGEKEWANAPKAKATCPRCSNEEAFFKEIQVRSVVTRRLRLIDCADSLRRRAGDALLQMRQLRASYAHRSALG